MGHIRKAGTQIWLFTGGGHPASCPDLYELAIRDIGGQNTPLLYIVGNDHHEITPCHTP